MHMNRMQRLFLAAACLGAAASGAEAPTEQPPEIEEVLVTAHPLGAEGLAQASDVLTADELERKMVDTIGATVGNEPGIHNSAYGVGAGRPVIRGLGGARVRIMEEQIDTLDVSVSSGDHAVTVDPFLAERVEILKGSATLLYGSGAIGGVVDVHTGRIPSEVPEQIHGALDVRGSDNGSGKNGSFRLDGGSGNVAWHVDAFSRESDDYDIPGYAESAALHAAEGHDEEGHGHEEEAHDEDDDHDHEDEHHDEEEHEEEEEAFGTVPGSAAETRGGSVGFSFVGERGFGGISISGLDSEYGIPGHSHAHHEHDDHDEEGHHDEEEHHDDEEEHAHEEHDDHEDEDHHGEESPPVVVLEQTRIDLEAGLADPFDGFESLSLRLGINDYEHVENEAGEVGTAFSNSAWEGRAQLTHEPMGGWRGAIGMQLGNREFSVVGEEAFTPPVDTSSSGFFWVGERSVGDLGLEAGVRYDRVEHSPANGQSRDFGGLSASMGLILPFSPNWQGSVLADYSSRAPVGEELFSDSPHPGTGVYEIGDANLDTEQARNLAATLTGGGDGWSLVGTTYYTSFAGFIYQAATDEEREGFDVRRYSQDDATFTGFEVEGQVTVAEWGIGTLDVGAFYDIVSPEIDVSGNDNLPLMPPSRVGVSLEFTGNRLRANVDYIRASEQDNVAEFELPTESYDDLRARIAWRFRPGESTVDLFLAGRNLTDDEQRLHTSVVKDMVPQPGRTIEAGLRMRF
ncbi:MAG: TonB-dependent receptor [Gammaproteobacteria bacterium]|nr:TonB-dependent receptor [Gammaproteobacteria bacterium]